jgi:hypothetical protein
MVELFAPLRGLNLDFEADRGRDTGRDIKLVKGYLVDTNIPLELTLEKPGARVAFLWNCERDLVMR